MAYLYPENQGESVVLSKSWYVQCSLEKRKEDDYQIEKIYISDRGFREISVDFRNEINEQVDVVLLTLTHVVHQANVEAEFRVDLFTQIWRKRGTIILHIEHFFKKITIFI